MEIYLEAPVWGQWSQGPFEREEGRDMTMEIKSEDASIAGFGHGGSSVHGMQAASES